jgi:hypothetical protein
MSTDRIAKLMVCLLVSLFATTPARAASDDGVAVSVAEQGNGAFQVSGTFSVSADLGCVWRVLTDYDQFGNFLPAMHSRIIRRSSSTVMLVEQESTTWCLGIPKKTHVVLQVQEAPPNRIEFADVSLKDFESYKGSWSLAKGAGEVRVSYEANTRPRFVPPICGKAIVADTVHSLLHEVRLEMLRRHSAN